MAALMFVQTEETPNPDTLKFFTGEAVRGDEEPLEFTCAQEAEEAPFARMLFEIEGVRSVFFGRDFISVTKESDHEWPHIKPFVFHSIIEATLRKLPVTGKVTLPAGLEVDLESYAPDVREIVMHIISTLEAYVRPAVAQDGGDVRFARYEDGKVFLNLRGACSGCPSSKVTLKSGIERTLKFYVPQVQEVLEEL